MEEEEAGTFTRIELYADPKNSWISPNVPKKSSNFTEIVHDMYPNYCDMFIKNLLGHDPQSGTRLSSHRNALNLLEKQSMQCVKHADFL